MRPPRSPDVAAVWARGAPGQAPICSCLRKADGLTGQPGGAAGSPRWRALAIAGFPAPFPPGPLSEPSAKDLITLGWAPDLLGHLAAQLEDPSGWQMIFLSGISH